MKLRAKFNIAILVTFALGFGLAATILDRVFVNNARSEAIEQARVLMSAANAIRHYTATQVEPKTGFEANSKFLPISVPAFAAQTNVKTMRADFPDFSYREPALNPTNLSDRPADWEADIINFFRNNPTRKDYVANRETPTGTMINLAHPIVAGPECLLCHSTPAAAPKSMTDTYGTANGFGWHEGEVIGAQIVSLPLAVPLAKGRHWLVVFLAVMTGIFILMTLVLNLLLHFAIIRPAVRMARIGEEVSHGDMSAEYLDAKGTDEIASLAASFNRMRRSLEGAMRMIDAEDSEHAPTARG